MENDIIERADDLKERIEHNIPAIKELIAYQERSRFLIKVAISLIVIVTLIGTIVMTLTFQVYDNTNNAKRQAAIAKTLTKSNNAACINDNQFKSDSLELWIFITEFPLLEIQTPSQIARTATIRELAERAFTPKDCILEEITQP